MISVIVPVYNEAKSLCLFHSQLGEVLNTLNTQSEVIYIDDGSTDNSHELLKSFTLSGGNVRIIRFKKNFGQTLAISAGISHSKGDVLIFIDADLQNAPRDIPKLLSKIEEGYDVASGWRKQRKDPFFSKIIPSVIGNTLISSLFGIKIHDLGCALKAYKRDLILDIKLYGEMHRLLPLYAAMHGASIAEVEVSHSPRTAGKSHYGWSRLIKVSLDLVTIRFFETYSTKPIYFFGGAGAGLFIIGAVMGVIVTIRTIFFKGIWVSPLMFIALMFIAMGVQFIFMGLLAEVIIRIYYKDQSDHTSTYIIKDVLDK